MVDIDDFKAINDRHGHDAGDRLLVEVGHRLRDGVRRQDTVARWGGEEFLLLLPDSQLAGAHTLADELRGRIAGTPFVLSDHGARDEAVTMTVTVGIGRFEAGMRLDDCIRAADAALYEGKRHGKDRSVVWRAAPERVPDGAGAASFRAAQADRQPLEEIAQDLVAAGAEVLVTGLAEQRGELRLADGIAGGGEHRMHVHVLERECDP